MAMRRRLPLRPLPPVSWASQPPTAEHADPALIAAAVARARGRCTGNWFAVGAAGDVRADRPRGLRVAGRELVVWRDRTGAPVIGPGACPHLGAPLARGRLTRDGLVCHWHGLCLPAEGAAGWRPLPAHDDGVLVWVRIDDAGEGPSSSVPVAAGRPPLAGAVSAVTTMTGICEPVDVIANRLDPWHGAWLHPYSFARLRMVEAPGVHAAEAEDRFVVAVTFRVGPVLGVPVLAEFRCPDARTVAMRIVEGEGTGSVVETRATPLGTGPDGRPRTAVVEATVATSGRPGFAVARAVAPLLRPLMRRTAARLWRDDLAYAERRYALRARGR
jgi:hypothetical protein